MVKKVIKQLSVLVLLLCLGVLVYYFTQEQTHTDEEMFKSLRVKYLSGKEGFRNMKVDTAAEIYHQYTGGMPSMKDMKDTNIGNSNAVELQLIDTKPITLAKTITPKCLDCEIIFNTFGFLVMNNNTKLALSLVEPSARCKNNVMMVEVISPVEKMRRSRWKLVEGLLGPEYVSFYNMDMECYLGRISDGSLHCLDIDLSHNVEKAMASFKLVDGLVDNKTLSLVCAPVHKETKTRLVSCIEDGSLRAVKLEDILGNDNIGDLELGKSCQFKWLNVENGKNIIQNKHHILHKEGECLVREGFVTSSGFTTTNSGRTKTKRSKRAIRRYIRKGELNRKELFTNPPEESENNNKNNDNKNNNEGKKQDVTKGGNIFKEHKGDQFNKILNKYVKSHREELRDDVFKKIENAKIDPSVQNLLDFNEQRFNIYQKENMVFSEKIDEKLKSNTDALDMNVRDLNNYRIDKLAEELFALQDELDKKRGIKN